MIRAAVAVAALFLSSTADAENTSAYTDFKPEACKQVKAGAAEGEGAFGPTFECKGYDGIPVTFAEDDLRSFVAYGRGGREHCAFRQSFSGFNSVGNRIEWRLKAGKPVATILRWKVSFDAADSSKLKDWLVVTKLENGNSCQIGFVEGGYPKANEKARSLADTKAQGFSCKTGVPTVLANPGTETTDIITAGVCQP
jgi:hypothetical protein